MLIEASAAYKAEKSYSIFLSHSVRDAELILGMKATFEDLGYSVYVDWIEDPQLDRSKVSAATANKLRQRMNSCRSLFYVTTSNSDLSKWMPWECGYFDGANGKVAIVPIQKASTDNVFLGQEYLGLYPYVVQGRSSENKERLWVQLDAARYVAYDIWVSTPRAQVPWRT